jgi:sulfopyruvate decarboxylase TPP-binding subunit
MIALLVLAVLSLAGMFMLADSAIQEAVYVGLACFFAICARLAQASSQHARLVRLLEEQKDIAVLALAREGEAAGLAGGMQD